jgi:hypothetical protein
MGSVGPSRTALPIPWLCHRPVRWCAASSQPSYPCLTQGCSGWSVKTEAPWTGRRTRPLEPRAYLVEPGTRLLEPRAHLVEPATRLLKPRGYLVEPGTRLLRPRAHLDEPGTRLLEPRAHLDDPGTRLLEPRAHLDDPGTRLLEPRPCLAEPGTRLLEPHAYLDEQGTRPPVEMPVETSERRRSHAQHTHPGEVTPEPLQVTDVRRVHDAAADRAY